MFSRRIAMAVLAAMLMSALTVAPAAAAKPTKPPAQPPPTGERPLTPEEEAASARKIAAADAYLASAEAQEAELVSLACVTPTSTGAEVATGAEVMGGVATDSETDATTQACYTPQGFVTVHARDQTAGHYCGPAVGQVIANYSWALDSAWNKYTQGRIAGWMSTDYYGQTDALRLEVGLEKATAGSPRRPANWNWIVSNLRDLNGNGGTGDELHSYLRSNVSGSRMPMAIPVKPHSAASNYNLSSWPNPVNSVGHWIAAYGWVGLYTGTHYARLYFTDSSRDEGGSTGKFYNSVLSVAIMVGQHTGRFVW